jgi:ATP-dependent DNA helicase PIF1
MLKIANVLKEENASTNYNDMLKDYLNMDINKINQLYEDGLNDIQKKAFNMFKENKNLSIIGFSGTGKSYLIKTINSYVKSENQKRIYLCSTTGISAYNIGGMTINSFMGIGTGESSLDILIKKVYRNKGICDRIYYTDILIIDEISMMSAALFEKIDLICQRIKRNKKFFGGIQLIITGDFLQLLPVFNNNMYKEPDNRLIIESDVFLKNFNNKNTIFLNENVRQKCDQIFTDLLMKIRYNNISEDDITLLKSRMNLKIDEDKEALVTLVSSNKKAQMINDYNLQKINKQSYVFDADFDILGDNEDVKKLLLTELQNQFNQKNIHKVILKKGIHVMLIKNLDIDLGLVNGSIGTIVNFVGGLPEVEFNNKIKRVIGYTQWELEMDNCKVIANQIPLMLAYALTIHKTQSITLDSAILDLADCFCEHQVYVALSRLRSLDGVYLKSFNPKKIMTNKKMVEYLQQMNLDN